MGDEYCGFSGSAPGHTGKCCFTNSAGCVITFGNERKRCVNWRKESVVTVDVNMESRTASFIIDGEKQHEVEDLPAAPLCLVVLLGSKPDEDKCHVVPLLDE